MNALLPRPRRVERSGGGVEVRGLRVVAEGEGAAGEAAFLAARLAPMSVGETSDGADLPVRLALRHEPELPSEGYRLTIDEGGIDLEAADTAGLHYAGRTLLQLLPDELHAGRGPDGTWRLPRLRIEDAPRFRWRGAMLDVSRHFRSVAFVERFIELLAQHRLNTLHLHLTDDQGWRIEIGRYPQLTAVGAWRSCTLIGHERSRPRRYDDTPHGGFYRQDEIRALVRYAAERHVTLVPEIDMPGHMQAAVAAYPELGATGRRLETRCHWGISQHILAPVPDTVRFLQGVLEEVMDLFPASFVHLGGDEALKHEWSESRAVQAQMAALGLADEDALQGWFLARMNETVRAAGRRAIGWDEILDGGLPEGAAVMSWRGFEGALAAASLGHDAVVAPTSHTYLDYYQSEEREHEPLAIGGFLPLERVWEFEPLPAGLPPGREPHILGAQAQLWSEYMPSEARVEYMAFPRLCALAEVVWTARGARGEFREFRERLERHLRRLALQEVDYRPLERT